MESHNHPSYIEPYQGAATGVGGIMRDVFTMGGRPIANLNALRFGEPSHPKTRSLVKGVVAGISGYRIVLAMPTVGGETYFHKSYNGNNLDNAMTVGLADQDKIFTHVELALDNRLFMSDQKQAAMVFTVPPWPQPNSETGTKKIARLFRLAIHSPKNY